MSFWRCRESSDRRQRTAHTSSRDHPVNQCTMDPFEHAEDLPLVRALSSVVDSRPECITPLPSPQVRILCGSPDCSHAMLCTLQMLPAVPKLATVSHSSTKGKRKYTSRKKSGEAAATVSIMPLPMDQMQQHHGTFAIAHPPGDIAAWPMERSVPGDHTRWCGVPVGCTLGHVEVLPSFIFHSFTSVPLRHRPGSYLSIFSRFVTDASCV